MRTDDKRYPVVNVLRIVICDGAVSVKAAKEAPSDVMLFEQRPVRSQDMAIYRKTVLARQ